MFSQLQIDNFHEFATQNELSLKIVPVTWSRDFVYLHRYALPSKTKESSKSTLSLKAGISVGGEFLKCRKSLGAHFSVCHFEFQGTRTVDLVCFIPQSFNNKI